MSSPQDSTVAALAGGGSIPILGFGTWQLQGRSAYEAVLTALEVGYRHIDTATMYANESEVGRAMRDSGLARQEIFLTTKLPPENAGRERQTLESSLSALSTDFVDLWLIHWPPRGRRASISVWSEFIALKEEGKARAIGVSNYSPGEIDELIEQTQVTPALNQIRWSPFIFDQSVLSYCQKKEVVLEGYSPFKASRLSHPLLVEVAQAHGVTPSQVVLRWHVEHGIVVIPKSARRERIEANFDIFGFSLDPEEVAAIDGLSPGALSHSPATRSNGL